MELIKGRSFPFNCLVSSKLKPSHKYDVSIGAKHSRDKQQQATTPLPIAMDVIKATTNCNGRN